MNFLLSIPVFGSIVNASAVIVGATIGYLLRSRIPENVMKLPAQLLGLFSFVLGVGMSMKSQNMLILVFSVAVGSIVGGLLDIEGRTERGVRALERRFKNAGSGFAEAFMSSSMLFCMGSMAILGAFEEGLGGYPSLFLTKALMDGLMGVALGASLGAGVILSAAPVFIYQAGLTLAASFLQPYITGAATVEMAAAGGLMLMGIGFNILGLLRVRVMDALPALVIAVVLVRVFAE